MIFPELTLIGFAKYMTHAMAVNILLRSAYQIATGRRLAVARVRHSARTGACHGYFSNRLGGDNSSKGTQAALALYLFRSLSSVKQRLVEKQIMTSEISLPPDNDGYESQMREVEKIICWWLQRTLQQT